MFLALFSQISRRFPKKALNTVNFRRFEGSEMTPGDETGRSPKGSKCVSPYRAREFESHRLRHQGKPWTISLADTRARDFYFVWLGAEVSAYLQQIISLILSNIIFHLFRSPLTNCVSNLSMPPFAGLQRAVSFLTAGSLFSDLFYCPIKKGVR